MMPTHSIRSRCVRTVTIRRSRQPPMGFRRSDRGSRTGPASPFAPELSGGNRVTRGKRGVWIGGALRLSPPLSLSFDVCPISPLRLERVLGLRGVSRSERGVLFVSLPFRLVPARWRTRSVGGAVFQPVTRSVPPPTRGVAIASVGVRISIFREPVASPLSDPRPASPETGFVGRGFRSPHLVFRIYVAIVPSSEHD